MDSTVKVAVIGALAGLISGALASLIAPWINWGIEKRRLRLQDRKELVDRWRDMCMNWRYHAPHNAPARLHLGLERSWISLKPKLKKSVLNEVIKHDEQAITYEQREQLASILLDDIARLEKKWGLR